MILGALALPCALMASTMWVTVAEGAKVDRTLTYQSLAFAVPRSWLVVSANRSPCTGSRPTVIVGTNTSSTPTCIAITMGPAQPSVTLDTVPFPKTEFLA